ncbi:hypothetical protein GYMLUDRAFT_255389 [Collybiopsis luxurians FD-317 M1]|nr:hypothetical protein GYMLUDRAFT_255389 [Collybiopsis luxurians FD-317 M1]
MLSSAPSFFQKISTFSPRTVCFVGLGIGEIVAKAISCPWKVPTAPRKPGEGKSRSLSSFPRKSTRSQPQRDRNSKMPTPASAPVPSPALAPSSKLASIRGYMLPVKLKYENSEEDAVKETLFFAIPSTSGANSCGYRKEDKIALFKELYDQLQLIKQGSPSSLDASCFDVVDISRLRA